MNHRPLRLAIRLIAAAGLSWAAWGLGFEVARAARLHARAPERLEGPRGGWRRTLHPVVRMEGFLNRTRSLLPSGSRVVFSTTQGTGSPDFFRYLWISYLRPDLTWIPAAAPKAGTGSYWVAFGKRETHPRLTLIFEEPMGAVYRIEPEAASPESPRR